MACRWMEMIKGSKNAELASVDLEDHSMSVRWPCSPEVTYSTQQQPCLQLYISWSPGSRLHLTQWMGISLKNELILGRV